MVKWFLWVVIDTFFAKRFGRWTLKLGIGHLYLDDWWWFNAEKNAEVYWFGVSHILTPHSQVEWMEWIEWMEWRRHWMVGTSGRLAPHVKTVPWAAAWGNWRRWRQVLKKWKPPLRELSQWMRCWNWINSWNNMRSFHHLRVSLEAELRCGLRLTMRQGEIWGLHLKFSTLT